MSIGFYVVHCSQSGGSSGGSSSSRNSSSPRNSGCGGSSCSCATGSGGSRKSSCSSRCSSGGRCGGCGGNISGGESGGGGSGILASRSVSSDEPEITDMCWGTIVGGSNLCGLGSFAGSTIVAIRV